MKRGLRAALVATAGATALGFAGSALAAYTPRITVSHTPLTIAGGGTTDLTISFDQADDATAKATIYVPQGYAGTLGAAAGTQLGTIDASIIASQISPTQPLPLKGTIQADDPSKYAEAGTRCTGVATHEAVWLLRLQAAGTELAVPGYLDTVTAPAEATLGKLKLQFCLPSPYIPMSAGGATLGAKLISATLHLKNAFTLPSQNGSYGWTVVATPYTVGTAVPNAAGTVQARAFVQLPAQLTLKAKVKKKSATLSGALKLNLAGLAGQKVTLLSGSSRTKLKAAGSATTRAGGAFSFRKTVRKATYFRVRVSVPVRATTCAGGVPGIPCAGATANAFTAQSAVVKVTPKRR
jgi:hypothetical protein